MLTLFKPFQSNKSPEHSFVVLIHFARQVQKEKLSLPYLSIVIGLQIEMTTTQCILLSSFGGFKNQYVF